MVDIHHHLLPGLDDGSKNFDTSIEMARLAAADGISHACGLLLLTNAGRMKVFRSRPDGLMLRYLETALPEYR